MSRTLCILVWTVVTYYTSLNMEQFGFGNLTQVIGLVIGTSLSAFILTAFFAKEREILKLGLLASCTCLVLAAMQDPQDYFTFYYNVDKSITLHNCLILTIFGTVGAIRCIREYEKSLRLREKAQSLLQLAKGLFAEG